MPSGCRPLEATLARNGERAVLAVCGMWLAVSRLSPAGGLRQPEPPRLARSLSELRRPVRAALAMGAIAMGAVAMSPVPQPVPTQSATQQQGNREMSPQAGVLSGPPEEAPGTGHRAQGLSLEILESGPDRDWTLRVVNRSSVRVALAADIRLLSFEVRTPGALRAAQCRLPKALAPRSLLPASVVQLDPGEAHDIRFDPRLFCFAGVLQKLIIPGSQISPRFGWSQPREGNPGAVAWPAATDGARPGWRKQELRAARRSPGHQALQGAAFALGPGYRSWAVRTLQRPPPGQPSAPTGSKTAGGTRGALELSPDPSLRLLMLQGADVADERSIELALGLENQASEPQRLFLRPEFWTLDVVGPDGPFTCKSDLALAPSSSDAFERVGVGTTRPVVLRPVEICPLGSFGRPGLYKVHATLKTSHRGTRFGLEAFVGRLETPQPALVRVHRGPRPFFHFLDATHADKAPRSRLAVPISGPAEEASSFPIDESPLPRRLRQPNGAAGATAFPASPPESTSPPPPR